MVNEKYYNYCSNHGSFWSYEAWFKLSWWSSNTTLLSTPRNYLLTANIESDLQGVYLYYDLNDKTWIRSGKVTGRGFDVRHKEHYQKSKCNIPQPKFNSHYSSKESKQSESRLRKGLFEGLVPFIACGFNPSDKNVLTKMLIKVVCYLFVN